MDDKDKGILEKQVLTDIQIVQYIRFNLLFAI